MYKVFSYLVLRLQKKCYHHPGALSCSLLRAYYPKIIAQRPVISRFGAFPVAVFHLRRFQPLYQS